MGDCLNFSYYYNKLIYVVNQFIVDASMMANVRMVWIPIRVVAMRAILAPHASAVLATAPV